MMGKDYLLGVDIGGTKCAIILGERNNSELSILDKIRFDTGEVSWTVAKILDCLDEMMVRHGLAANCSERQVKAVGISCGGPLDSRKGIVMSPPNLPGWDHIEIVREIEERTGIRAALQNDANACALAEWKFGAGRGSRNMVFLTFGTGLGAGLIIDGHLYSGTNDNAGELGHIRLADFGPVGYGKQGSFEGFASGGGIAQLAASYLREAYQKGTSVSWCTREGIPTVTAKDVAVAASSGDALALEILNTSARFLGKGLSIVIDILNPEVIVIGSIYARNEQLMKPQMQEIIDREALHASKSVCMVVPAALGEAIGDYAALSIAADFVDKQFM